MYGNDAGYAATRLDHTVVRLGNEPVYIHRVHIDGSVVCTPLGKLNPDNYDESEFMRCQLKDLDLRPVPLGYVKFKGGTGYVMRVPKRQDWRQGLRKNNFIVLGADKRRVQLHHLDHMIRGDYITFKEAVKKANRYKETTYPWHKDWAIFRDRLFYKAKVVGTIVNGKPELDDKFQWLEEALGEANA